MRTERPSWDKNEDVLIDHVMNGREYKDFSSVSGFSIGAVCAKVKRLREQGRIPVDRCSVTTTTERKTVARPARAMMVFAPKCKASPTSLALLRKLEDEAREATGLLTLDERLEREEKKRPTCCYPVGEPGDERIYCSGERLPGSSWCEEHHKRCHERLDVVPVQMMKGEVRQFETA